MEKAYAYDDEFEGTTEIYWAKTAGQAKAYFANENDLLFTEVSVYRVPWADKYKSMEEIPPDVYWENGWWLPCEKCGSIVAEGEGRATEKGVLCLECLQELSEEE